MNYIDDIEGFLKNFSKEEKIALVERLGIDLYEPEQMLCSPHVTNEIRKKIREIEKKALQKLHPEKSYPEPRGPECSLCGITENEVSKMAQHESGFNICGECVDLYAEVLREKRDE